VSTDPVTGTTTLHVGGASPYDVLVGAGVSDALAEQLPRLVGDGAQRIAVIHPVAMATRAIALRDALTAGGYDTRSVEIPDGEAAKTADVAAFCWDVLGRAGFTRSDAVVTLGGGATTDLGGFVAATWLRGVKVVHVPTTLLAMVDAAVGGKTGINTAAGKNLVGSFHEPAGVVCDLDLLRTLPHNELVSGLAEVVKCGFIADPRILELVEEHPTAATDPTSGVLRELVERAIQVKIDVVVDDLTEQGGREGHPGREALNYGHTLGHAVERVEDYRFRHGAAVAIGMRYVAELARLSGRLDDATADRHERVLRLVGLPTGYRGDRWEDLHAAMRVDKKSRGSTLRFIVLDALARPTVLAGPSDDLLREAYARISD